MDIILVAIVVMKRIPLRQWKFLHDVRRIQARVEVLENETKQLGYAYFSIHNGQFITEAAQEIDEQRLACIGAGHIIIVSSAILELSVVVELLRTETIPLKERSRARLEAQYINENFRRINARPACVHQLVGKAFPHVLIVIQYI